LKELKIEPMLAKISKCKSTGFNMLTEFKETDFHINLLNIYKPHGPRNWGSYLQERPERVNK
jgi:hypothetical protein